MRPAPTLPRARVSFPLLAAMLALGVLGSSAFAAQDSASDPEPKPGKKSHPEARFSLQIESYLSSFDTTVAVNRDDLGFGSLLNLGTRFDVEDSLGIDDDGTAARIRFTTRFGRRHRLRLSYYNVGREGSRTIESPTIRLFDRPFNVNLDVDSEIDLDIYVVEWGYSFRKRNRTDFGFFLGLNTMVTRLEVRARARVTGRQTDEVVASGEETTDPTIPLPVIGLFGGYRPLPKLQLGGSARVFALEFGDYSGSLVDVELYLEYLVLKNLALGINGSIADIGLEAESSDNNAFARLDLERNGASFYLRFRFGGMK